MKSIITYLYFHAFGSMIHAYDKIGLYKLSLYRIVLHKGVDVYILFMMMCLVKIITTVEK